MGKMSKTEALNRIAEQGVPDHLDLWPQIRARVKAAGATPGQRAKGKLNTRRLVLGGAVAVLLALIVLATSPAWNAPEAVSAQSILDRAASTDDNGAAAVHTYHLKMTRQFSGKGNTTLNTEIWFGGHDRQRSDQQVRDAGGNILSSSEVIFNGREAWIAKTEQGQTWVVHTIGTTWTEPAEDPSRQHSLTDVLAQYNSDKSCMDTRLQGDASVAGHATYIIEVTPKPLGCALRLSNPAGGGAVGPAEKNGQVAGMVELGQMLVWVDKLTFLPLKTEVHSPTGNLLDQSVVTSVEYNVAIPGTVFTYTAPAGARLFNFSGGDGADVKAALCGEFAQGNCPPPKKP